MAKATKGWLSPKWRAQIQQRNPSVKCAYCPFTAANNWLNFATKYRPSNRQHNPCCHACSRKRREERIRVRLLTSQLRLRERLRRRKARKTMTTRLRRKEGKRDMALKHERQLRVLTLRKILLRKARAEMY